MTVLITLTTAGADSGPFDLYSNVDGFVSAFETGVSKAALVAGYSSSLVPNGTTTIRVKSTGVCTNYIDIIVVTTTTTTTTGTPTTTTTTTPAPSFYSYEISSTSDADPGLACLLSYGPTVYAAESTSAAVTRFYVDMALTTPFTGTGDYYRYTKVGSLDNVRAQVNLGGFVSNIGSC